MYQTKAEITFDEYRRFCNAVRSRSIWTTILIDEVLFILLGLLFSRWFVWVMVIAIGVLFPLILRAVLNRRLKEEYCSNLVVQGDQYTLLFYKDHLEKTGRSGTMQVQYRQIYQIVETKTNFYIMISKNQGIIVVKQNCLPELIAFLSKLKMLGKGK